MGEGNGVTGEGNGTTGDGNRTTGESNGTTGEGNGTTGESNGTTGEGDISFGVGAGRVRVGAERTGDVDLGYNQPMKSPIVALPQAVHAELSPRLAADFPNVAVLPYAEAGDLPPGIENTDAVFRWIAGHKYRDVVAAAPGLRWIHTASAGVDHVLTPEIVARENIVITDSGDAFAIAIGEFVVAWMLMVCRRLPELLKQQEARMWHSLTQEELAGQTAGIIGLGPIGRGIATRCRALGVRTMGFRRSDTPCPDVDETLRGRDGLSKLLRESNWVILAAALTGESRQIIGADELALMKPNARIINIARGGLVDQNALVAALQSGKIAGACLDVFEKEPLTPDDPLWAMPNVFIAPHNSGGWTAGLRERQKRMFLANLERFVRGEELAGVVDVRRGY